jgi:hypothetical protein
MPTLKTLAIAVAFLGSASLAFAQGPGIAPNGSVLPPQTNPQGPAASPSASSQSAHVKKSHRLYNMSTTSKKKHPTTSK